MIGKRSQRDRVLELLADGRWHSARELVEQGIWRYAARVFELRLAGHAIETRAGVGRLAEYRLIQLAAAIELERDELEQAAATGAVDKLEQTEQLLLDEAWSRQIAGEAAA